MHIVLTGLHTITFTKNLVKEVRRKGKGKNKRVKTKKGGNSGRSCSGLQGRLETKLIQMRERSSSVLC